MGHYLKSKAYISGMKRFLWVLLLLSSVARAQEVYEPVWKSSYDFLGRLAQRGLIDLNDVIQPISRKTVQEKLDELYQQKEKLTPLEKKELDFYLKDYKLDRFTLDTLAQDKTFKSFFAQKAGDRFRPIAMYKEDFSVNLQPIIGGQFAFRGGEQVFQRNSGFWLYGYVKKRFGYSFSFNEASESGQFVDKTKEFTPVTGYVGIKKSEAIQYSDFRTNISYTWDWGRITAGRDHLLWGYGANGRLVLSQKPPAYPFVRLDVQPTPWLGFNMTVLSLNSMVADSNTIHPTWTTGIQIDYIQKNLSSHSFILRPIKGLSISFGESIVYNNSIKLGYLVPLNFFKALSHYKGEQTENNSAGNSQFFIQFSSRGHIPNTHAYFSFFVDEMSFSKFFNKEEMRNQTGYTGGVSITNFPLKNMYFQTEYTRTRPYNYLHYIPSQTYTNNNYNLGHWIGANADQWYSRVRYRAFRGLTAESTFALVRKGSVPGKDDFQQDERGTPFLWGKRKNYQIFNAGLSYELIHDLFLKAYWKQERLSGTTKIQYQTLSMGLRYGF